MADVYTERMRGLDHLRRRSAATVAEPEQVQRAVGARGVLEVAHARLDLLRAEVPVVCISRRKVGKHAGSVNSLPQERVMRWLVGVVPGQLLGQEVFAARFLDQLRKVARIAKNVGQPQDLRLVTELVQEEALAVHELPHERFT